MIENIGAYSQVDYDRGYQQGREDAIDEIIQRIKEISNKDVITIYKENLDDIAKELKEQNTGQHGQLTNDCRRFHL